MTALLVFVMWSFFGWLLFFMGLSSRRDWRRRDETQTAHADGVIEAYVAKRTSGKNYSYHLPVVRFVAEGQEYRLESEFAMKPDELPVGTPVQVCYDPADPTRFHLDLEEVRHGNTNGPMTFGIVWILISLIGVLVLHSLSNGYGLNIIDSLGLREMIDRLSLWL